jgi:O-antigen/teichoic acid export membrane protein
MYRLYFILDLIVLAVFAVIYFLVDPLYQGLTIDEKSQFKVVWIISGVFSLISFPCSIFGGTLSAYEEYIWIKVIDVVNKILYILFISLSLAFNWGLYALVIIQSGANLFCIGIKYLVMHFKLGVKADFHYRTTWKDTKGIIVYSLWAAIVSICSRLIFSVTPSILGIVSNSTNITVFSTAAALEACTYLFSSVMSGFFLPKISRIYSDKTLDSGKEITALGIRVGKIQFFIMALIFVGFVCCGQEFVHLWLGDSDIYNPVYAGTLAMIAYDLFSIPEIVFNTAMYANNNLKHLTLSMIITSSINVGLSFLLSYYYGAFGACMAIGISRFVQLFIDNYFYKKDLHISLWPFVKAVFTKPSITAFVALGVGLLMLFFMPTSPAWTFAIQVCSMIVVYCVVGWFVSFDKEERQLIKDQAASFIKRG